jgi:hypothetical protein
LKVDCRKLITPSRDLMRDGGSKCLARTKETK